MKQDRNTVIYTVDAAAVIRRPAMWFAAMLELEARQRALSDWIDELEQDAEACRLMTVRPLPCEFE